MRERGNEEELRPKRKEQGRMAASGVREKKVRWRTRRERTERRGGDREEGENEGE